VKFLQRQAAPWGPKYSKPRHAVLRIKEGAGKVEHIGDFRSFRQRLKVDRAERNPCAAKCLGDREKRLVSAAQESDAELLAVLLRLLHSRLEGLNKFNDLMKLVRLCLRSGCYLVRRDALEWRGGWNKLQVERAMITCGLDLASLTGCYCMRVSDSAAVIGSEYLLEDAVEAVNECRRGAEVRGQLRLRE
jgi:hypothetical protein